MTVTAQGKLFLASMQKEEMIRRTRDEMDATDERSTAEAIAALEAAIVLVHERGYATNLGENESEIGAVAVPVRTSSGDTILTLSVFGILSSFDDVLLERAKRALFDGAQTLEASLRDRGRDRLRREGNL